MPLVVARSRLARVLHAYQGMRSEQPSVPVSILAKRSGLSFYTRRVLQRWVRGEISTDTAIELIQWDDAARIIGTWTNA